MVWWLVGAALAVTPLEVPDPRPRGSWVVDLAEVLDPGETASLDARLQALHDDLTVEIAVVTVPTAGSLPPKAFATTLFNRWGIGRAGVDNGLLVLLVLDVRRLEMETGYGLEPVLPDGWLGQMQVRQMVPHFKGGRYGAGLLAGLDATAQRLRSRPLEARLGRLAGEVEVGDWPERPPVAQVRARDPKIASTVGYGGAGLVAALGLSLFVRRRSRTCPDCRVYMPMLDEEADDAHLTAGQRTEEAIGSVDWQVHPCPTCDHVRTFQKTRWMSGYSTCPRCSHRTRRSTRTTVRAPTYSSTGTAEITEQCAHCSYQLRRTVVLPRLEASTSSSSSFGSSSSGGGFGSSSRGGGSSGGGGFGGGRSGGGGAGSSW